MWWLYILTSDHNFLSIYLICDSLGKYRRDPTVECVWHVWTWSQFKVGEELTLVGKHSSHKFHIRAVTDWRLFQSPSPLQFVFLLPPLPWDQPTLKCLHHEQCFFNYIFPFLWGFQVPLIDRYHIIYIHHIIYVIYMHIPFPLFPHPNQGKPQLPHGCFTLRFQLLKLLTLGVGDVSFWVTTRNKSIQGRWDQILWNLVKSIWKSSKKIEVVPVQW